MEMPKISDAEWEVMQVLWRHSPATAEEMIDQSQSHDWSPTTIKTLISRLVKRGRLRMRQKGRFIIIPGCVREGMLSSGKTLLLATTVQWLSSSYADAFS